MFGRVVGDALPKKIQHFKRAMFFQNRGAAHFDKGAANRFKRGEIEFLLAVVTNFGGGICTGLHSISRDHSSSRMMLNDQMIADVIELVGVVSGSKGAFKAFPQFNVESQQLQTT